MTEDRFKFRFYDKDKKIMIEENSDYEEIRTIYGRDEWWWCIEAAMPTMFEYFDEDEYRKKDFVIMQCTGLKDKNGKLIYEGDIVDKGTRCKWIITWFKNRFILVPDFEYKNKDKGASDRDCGFKYFENNHSYADKDDEVIGNIYENPELLEE